MVDSLVGFVSLLQPVIIAGTTITGAVVAVMGLRTWRKQLKGRAEYDLARRLLRATLELRDAIQDLRRPLMSAGEIAAAAEEAGVEIDPQGVDNAEAIAAARSKRWRAVQEAASALRIEELEAEVLWGRDVAACTEDLRAAVHDVWAAEAEFHDRTRGDYRTDEDRERLPQLRRVMYGSGIDGDETETKISEAVGVVESEIRPRLTP